MKKFLALLLALTLALSLAVPAYAADTVEDEDFDWAALEAELAKAEAEQTGVEMRMYRVIYDAINDVSDAMKGMLAPKFREVSLGELQVRQVYKISNVGTVAGCRVTSGKITRDSKVRVVRDGIVICEDSIASLKRFKDDAKEVIAGMECGIGIDKYNDVKPGDVIEAFQIVEIKRTL